VILGQHRSSLEILVEILRAARTGARKTRIMYRANLGFSQLKRYLNFALETGLIIVPPESTDQYLVSPMGREFLEKYDKYLQRNERMKDLLQSLAKEKTELEDFLARHTGSDLSAGLHDITVGSCVRKSARATKQQAFELSSNAS
jgi:predicted transcriptional regulator